MSAAAASSSSPPTNEGAFLMAKRQRPLVVREAPYTSPQAGEVVVRTRAVATNPLEFMKVQAGNLFSGWVQYPFVMGSDLAGDVVEVGPGVSRFAPGDRVVALCAPMDKRANRSAEGAFQRYVVVRAGLASPIPEGLDYSSACVLPLGLSTAACGLFMKDYLALNHPRPGRAAPPAGRTVLVWGASSSVGSNAVQLAVAAGYGVVATASPKHFDQVKRLGATQVFDYRSDTVARDITAFFNDGKQICAGGLAAAGANATDMCLTILGGLRGKEHRKFVAFTTAPMQKFPETTGEILGTAVTMSAFVARAIWKTTTGGVTMKSVWGTDLMANEVGKAIFEDFLPETLARGQYMIAPEPMIVGSGLGDIQKVLDLHEKGVSAKKPVITL